MTNQRNIDIQNAIALLTEEGYKIKQTKMTFQEQVMSIIKNTSGIQETIDKISRLTFCVTQGDYSGLKINVTAQQIHKADYFEWLNRMGIEKIKEK